MGNINLVWKLMSYYGMNSIFMITLIIYAKKRYFDKLLGNEKDEIETRCYFYVFAIFVLSCSIFAVFAIIGKTFFEAYFYWLALSWLVLTFIFEALPLRWYVRLYIYKNHN